MDNPACWDRRRPRWAGLRVLTRRAVHARERCCRRAYRWRAGRSGGCGGSLAAGGGSGIGGGTPRGGASGPSEGGERRRGRASLREETLAGVGGGGGLWPCRRRGEMGGDRAAQP